MTASRAPMRVVVAITAAGASSRMGRSKALLPWKGSTLLALMVETVRQAGLDPPAVIVGADADQVAAEARRLGARPVLNPEYRKGRFTSVRAAARWALAECSTSGALPALLLCPVDCPAVSRETLVVLCAAATEHPDANVVPVCRDRSGHPVVLCSGTLTAIEAAPDDAILREFLGLAPQGRLALPVDDPAVLDNLNTFADYRAFQDARGGIPTHVD